MASGFSAVDCSPEPQRFVQYLDEIGVGAMKHYMAAAHALRDPRAPVLVIGCGAGHDLTALRSAGVNAVGIDPSDVMLATAAKRGDRLLVGAAGEHLPFADHRFAGCQIERVLMHVADPAVVVDEVVRCVEPGGLLTMFEPDWSTLTVNGASVPTNWVSGARHPSIGGHLGEILRSTGCDVVDRVEERSVWDFARFSWLTNIEASLDRTVAIGALSRRDANDWLEDQRRRAAEGAFQAEIAKVLWVANTPAVDDPAGCP